MNVSLTPELEHWVDERVRSGRYASASEVIREALRLLEDQEAAKQRGLESVRLKIDRGLDQLRQGLFRFRQNKSLSRIVPLEFEAPGESRNPNLPDRGIRTYNEAGRRILELNTERPGVEIGFKLVPVSRGGQFPVQILERLLGSPLKFAVIHGYLLPSRDRAGADSPSPYPQDTVFSDFPPPELIC